MGADANDSMRHALREHWPEYAMEAAGLGCFMVAACVGAAILEHPASPLHRALPSPLVRRCLMGLAMGVTAATIVYSPWGRRSGAHLNPALTLTFLRLGKVARWDAVFYVGAQFLGGIAGVVAAALVLRGVLAHPAVQYVVTIPGAGGAGTAFAAELLISFVLVAVVLTVSNTPRVAPFTGLCAGALVATCITLEAPLSGMSMNPARTLGSALPAGVWTALWVYFTAPPLGMLLAAEGYVRVRGAQRVLCAKLQHDARVRCIFRCGYAMSATPAPTARPPDGGRTPRARVACLALVAVVLARGTAAAGDVPLASAVVSVGITVADMERSLAFYRDVLSFALVSDVEVGDAGIERLEGVFGLRLRVVRMRLGDETLELTEPVAPRGQPVPADSRSDDRWFQHVAIIVSDMDAAFARLRAHHVEPVSAAPQRLPDWNPNAAGIRAFYFKDPDGHALEVLQFPEGKGAPKWQRRDAGLFLGIDHTAIAVGDTAVSLAFYRDVLGLTVAGESENYGPEQERLNAVPGAHLRITTLRAAAGPGIELLEYLAPRRGRAYPADARAVDLVQWQTTVATPEAQRGYTALRAAHAWFVSPGVVAVDATNGLGFRAGLLVRDPDGHAVRFVER